MCVFCPAHLILIDVVISIYFLWKLNIIPNMFLLLWGLLTSDGIDFNFFHRADKWNTRKLHCNSSRSAHTTHHTPHIASTFFFFSVYLISHPILIFLLAFPSQHFQLLLLRLIETTKSLPIKASELET